jgi:hypothetical protein
LGAIDRIQYIATGIEKQVQVTLYYFGDIEADDFILCQGYPIPVFRVSTAIAIPVRTSTCDIGIAPDLGRVLNLLGGAGTVVIAMVLGGGIAIVDVGIDEVVLLDTDGTAYRITAWFRLATRGQDDSQCAYKECEGASPSWITHIHFDSAYFVPNYGRNAPILYMDKTRLYEFVKAAIKLPMYLINPRGL